MAHYINMLVAIKKSIVVELGFDSLVKDDYLITYHKLIKY